MTDVTYPDVTVQLVGQDGNAFAILGRVKQAIGEAHGSAAASEFVQSATSAGSYDELLQFVQRTVNVE